MTKRQSPSSSDQPPVPIAVALEEQAGASVPIITASGRGFVAEQILAIAFANGVKVREDADLVQVLSAVDVDSEIPTEAFAAVSEILAYVYKANGKVPPAPFQLKDTLPTAEAKL
ncbi:MAG: flagellar protein FhlB [Rhodospirillaceae bacterium]|nr:flagellar protein FhlB [Rhodospirillaceae bacterium]